MFTEAVKVLSIDNESVNVEILDSQHCTGCSASSSCGQRLLSKLHPDRSNSLRIPNVSVGLQSGDTVLLGVNESMLLRLSFLFYMLPLACMLGFVLLADWLDTGELLSILAAFTGLGVGFVGLKMFTTANKSNPKFQAALYDSSNKAL